MNQKFLNFMLLFFLGLLIFNSILPWKKESYQTWVHIKTQSQNYSVPDVPILQIENLEKTPFIFNTCTNFEIYKNSKKVEKINEVAPSFCQDISVNPNTTYWMNISKKEYSLYKLYQSSWDFSYKIKTQSGELIWTTKQNEKWAFGTFFSTVFYAPVLNLFVFLINILPNHSLALAIILLTLIIRFLVLVPQHHMLVNSKKLQEIQPKIKELQEKHKEDQSKLWMELMELYKREKVNPAWSCLPLLIQMPILFVLYWVISSITNVTNEYFLYPFFSGFDISKIDYNMFGINLLAVGWTIWFIAAIIIWVSQWLQMYLSMKKDPKDKAVQIKKDIENGMPDMEIMNKTMMFTFPIMIWFSAYYFPIWVSLYWFIGTVFSICQQLFVNKILKKEKK